VDGRRYHRRQKYKQEQMCNAAQNHGIPPDLS
jgi:hypothetical protein